MDRRKHAIELIQNDFLKYADSSNVASLNKDLQNSFNIYDEENLKIAHIDAEELAEFSFDFFLPSINRILGKRNMELSVEKLNDDEGSFDVLINDEAISLFAQKDMEDYTYWDTAPRSFFRKVNEILEASKLDERFYLLYGGNDLHAMLLTEVQFEIISDYYKSDPREAPYKP